MTFLRVESKVWPASRVGCLCVTKLRMCSRDWDDAHQQTSYLAISNKYFPRKKLLSPFRFIYRTNRTHFHRRWHIWHWCNHWRAIATIFVFPCLCWWNVGGCVCLWNIAREQIFHWIYDLHDVWLHENPSNLKLVRFTTFNHVLIYKKYIILNEFEVGEGDWKVWWDLMNIHHSSQPWREKSKTWR